VDPIPIEAEGRRILGRLQDALVKVVNSLPGENQVARAVDLQRMLGLDKKLGWQLFKFITAEDPFSDVRYLPGEPSMRRILSAASRRRVPKPVVDAAAQAYERFENFAAAHGSDRSDLLSLTSGLAASGGDQQHDLRIRKSVFRGLTHIWGIKTETCIRTMAFGPGAPGTQDLLGVRGDIGLQRLRRGVPLTIAMATQNHPSDEPAEDPRRDGTPPPKLVRPEQSLKGLQLLEQFSTQPLPRFEPRVQADGTIATDIVFPPSGRSGAVTLYGAQHVAATATGEQTRYSQGSLVNIPCERTVCELLVPAGWSDPATVRVAVYGRRGRVDRVFERRTADLLPQYETATYLGQMETAPPISGAPHHPEAVHSALTLVSWEGMRYDVYRCTIEYPVLHTMISLDVDAIRRAGEREDRWTNRGMRDGVYGQTD
jgi:hypothetical protein